ncbi:hypothetical protein P3T37_002680 [Kitasatospora sp. MAA4]|uniref:hypothetical protein n=1 Tax=Kitasatospora sp. MAA4 TaxID=3035093 RepID=UPI0024737801|nr:hypothetical protein [Kitasatospora sp. MAA4]MDH6133285.1 hypothetical protein [Kitasatospora sp. MAA4]
MLPDDDDRAQRELTIRQLIAGLLAGQTAAEEAPGDPPLGGPDFGGGLVVPQARAAEVIAAAEALARRGTAGRPVDLPSVQLRLIAEALVIDEHPSAAGWTARERQLAAHWVAVLIERFGEDGVQRLLLALTVQQ